MKNPHYPTSVIFDATTITVTLRNGETYRHSLDLYPFLKNAPKEALINFELLPFSIYFPSLDEGLDIEGIRRVLPCGDVKK